VLELVPEPGPVLELGLVPELGLGPGLVPVPELGPVLELGLVPVPELGLGLHNQQQPIHSLVPPPLPKLISVFYSLSPPSKILGAIYFEPFLLKVITSFPIFCLAFNSKVKTAPQDFKMPN
jgi:hypothetical protein